MKNNVVVFDKILFPINPELDNRSSYRLIRALANDFRSEIEIVGSTGTQKVVDKLKLIQFNEEIETLKTEFDLKSDSSEHQITFHSISDDYAKLLKDITWVKNFNLIVFTIPFLITNSLKSYIDLIEGYLSEKDVSFLLIPEKASVSSFEKVTITSQFNTKRLDIAMGITDFSQKHIPIKFHLLNLLSTDEKSNSLIARYLDEMKLSNKLIKLTYSNKQMNINGLTIDRASSIDSDLVIRIIRDELSNIRVQFDSSGVSTFNATPVLLIFE